MNASVYVLGQVSNTQELTIFALRSAGFDTRGFGSGAELLGAVGEVAPDVVVMDTPGPGGGSLDILAGLKASHPDVPVIITAAAAMGEEFWRICGLEAGADYYMAKPISVLELVSRVRGVLRRNRPQNPELERNVMLVGKLEIYPETREVFVDSDPIELALKEYELLFFLVTNRRKVLSRQKILENVWGCNYKGGVRTVDIHIRRLRVKLKDEVNHIETVRNVGYRLV